MNRIVFSSITLFSLTVIVGLLGLSRDVSADGSKEVVLVRCQEVQAFDPGPPPTFTLSPYEVANSNSSAGAPPIDREMNCAQALANLRNAGFKITRVKGDASNVLYTLQSRRD